MKRKSDLFVGIVASVVLNASAFGLAGWSLAPKKAQATQKEDKEAIIITFDEVPVPPEEIKPEELPDEPEDNSEPSDVAAASLPEPPANLSLASEITQTVTVRPPVPPRPDALSRGLLPSRRGSGGSGGSGSGIPNVFSLAQLDRQPQVRVQTPPQYPFELRRAGISGSAEIFLLVDESGSVVETNVVKASHPEFGQSAMEAVRRWKFRPGTVNGRPVKFQFIAPLSFRLNDE